MYVCLYVWVVDGVAQWLGRRSLSGGLSLTHAEKVGHSVDKLSAVGLPTRPTQPSIPPGLVNE